MASGFQDGLQAPPPSSGFSGLACKLNLPSVQWEHTQTAAPSLLPPRLACVPQVPFLLQLARAMLGLEPGLLAPELSLLSSLPTTPPPPPPPPSEEQEKCWWPEPCSGVAGPA